jgi:methionine-rich copper-binding protein CopC
MRSLFRLPVLFAVVLVAGLSAGLRADMHLRLVKAVPAQDTTVAKSPEAVQLWFSEEPQIRLTTVHVRGADGRSLELDNPAATDGDGTHVTAVVPQTLSPGNYTVSWRTMAKDGHVVRGEYAFRIEVVE